MFASGFSWLGLLSLSDGVFAGLDVEAGTATMFAHAMVASLLLIGLGLLGRLGLERARAKQDLSAYYTDDTLTVRTGFEIYATGVLNLMNDLMDKRDVRTFFPWIATMFLYIFVCNLMGLIPGFVPPTDNVNTNVGMAVISFFVFNFVGLSRDPVGYIKHMMGPMLAVAPLIFSVELIGLLFRPVTLSLRLTGNMFGDHTVFGVMSDLVPAVVPVAFLALALFVSFMQAFIFSLLSTIYVALAVPHHDDHDAH